MTAELRAYIQHLLIVGGRTVSIAPPGALAELAPHRAARARAGDTFFILVTPFAGTHASATQLEGLSRLAADVYFGSGGGITGGLREALSAIHTLAQNDALRVDALALALRDDQLYAARAGAALGALTQPDAVHFLPADRHDPLETTLLPLGAGAGPDLQLARYTLAPGQMMLLADGGLLNAADDAIGAALIGGDLDSAIEQVKALAGSTLSASVIRFAAANEPGPDHLTPRASLRTPRSMPAPREPLPSEPPAAPEPMRVGAEPGASPPVEAAPGAGAPPEFRVRPHDPLAAPEASAEIPPATPDEAPQAASAGSTLRLPNVRSSVETGEIAASAGRAAERLRESWQRAADVAASAAQDQRARAPERMDRLSVTLKRVGRDGLRAVLTGLLAIFDALSRGLSAILPEPGEEGRQGIPTNVAVGMAVIIPVVIVVAVLGLALSQRGRSEFASFYERARTAHAEALALSGTTGCPPNTRPKWEEVLWLADQARDFRPDDLNVLQIRADAMNYLDCFDRVQRRDLTMLHEFGPNADLAGPVVHNGVELYVLDRAADAIYHDTLNETGTGLTSRGDAPIIRRGQAISGFTIGELIDIDWLRSGGTTHDNVLIALDANGVLIAHSWTFAESAQQLVIEQRWITPVAMAVFRENLYVLDTGANQVWRYMPPAGERRYSNAPDEYFTGADRPDLSGAVDLGISETGEVFILFGDGTVQRYLSGKPQEFAYSLKPEGALESGASLFVDNDREARTIFIVDPATEAIYETSWAGTFQRGFRPRNLPDAFERLTGFYADTVERNNLYVLSGNKLYQFPRN